MPPQAKNRIRMADVWVRRITTAKEREEFLDTTVPRLALRVYRTGRKMWQLRYTVRGAEKRFALGEYPGIGLSEARELARAEQGRIAKGIDPQRERRAERGAETFGGLAAIYLERARREKRTWREDERILRGADLKSLQGLTVREVQRLDVTRVLEKILKRNSPIMANRVRALLSRILNFAVELQLIDHNPVAGTRPPAREQRRERVLRDDELRALWAVWVAERSISSAAFQVLLLTGQRVTEVLSMRWDGLDVSKQAWAIPAGVSKNRRGQTVFLASPSLAIVEELRPLTGDTPWVFASPKIPGKRIVSLNTAFARTVRQSGVTDWHPHDLRRTAATGMAELGVTEAAIGAVLNHSPRGVTAQVYIRAGYARETAAAWEAWAAHVVSVVGT